MKVKLIVGIALLLSNLGWAADSQVVYLATWSALNQGPDAAVVRECRMRIQEFRNRAAAAVAKLGLTEQGDFFINEEETGLFTDQVTMPGSHDTLVSIYCQTKVHSANPNIRFSTNSTRERSSREASKIEPLCQADYETILKTRDGLLHLDLIRGKKGLIKRKRTCKVEYLEITKF